MKQPLCFAVASLCLGLCSSVLCQSNDCSTPVEQHTCNGCRASDSTAIFISKKPLSGRHFWRNVHLSGGQLTIPFKIRPKKEHGTFRLTTDVTIGAYIGLSKQLSDDKQLSLTIPLAAGLTFININDENTSLDMEATGADVVPGLSWSSGFILQFEKYNVGLIFGKDYASEVGDQWKYHGKWWWSFGMGFSFLQ